MIYKFQFMIALPNVKKSVSMMEGGEKKVGEDPNVSLGKAAIKNFCEASTIHGISSIFLAKNVVTRLFWIAMFLSVCSLLLWEVLQLVKKITSNDVVMTSRRVFEREIEFPVVILSNADPYSKAKLSKFPQKATGTGKLDHLRDILSNLSSAEALELGSYLGYSCQFGGTRCLVERLAVPWIGNYLRFNGDIIWKQKNPGPEHGLQMIVVLNESDYSNTFDNGQGVFVSIDNTPFLTYSLQRNKGVVAAPGTLTRVKMKKKKLIRLPYPYPDKCIEDTDVLEMKGFHFKVPLGRYYSVEYCTFLTMFRNQMISCGVVDPEYKFLIERYMFVEKSNVSFNISGNASEIESIHKCLERVASESTMNDCRPPCTDKEYDFTISHLRWPSAEEAKEKLERLKTSGPNASSYQNWTLDNIYKNMLKIEIYFSDFNVEVMEQKPAYGYVDFASDLGGQIGLWIGASVYSAFEVWSLLVSLTYYLFRSACNGGWIGKSRSKGTKPEET